MGIVVIIIDVEPVSRSVARVGAQRYGNCQRMLARFGSDQPPNAVYVGENPSESDVKQPSFVKNGPLGFAFKM